MPIPFKDYLSAIRSEFAFYGFTRTPINTTQAKKCYSFCLPVGVVYTIGCDIEAGYTFNEAFSFNA